jgi:hypothetical protein
MTRPLVKRIEMALHVQELCAEHDITVKYQSLSDKTPSYYANPRHKLICIRPTKNTGYYVSALHEIGHIIGPNQSANNDTMEKEIGAWKYAMSVAIVWTDTATNIMKRALLSYGMPSSHWDQVYNECCAYADAYKSLEVDVA